MFIKKTIVLFFIPALLLAQGCFGAQRILKLATRRIATSKTFYTQSLSNQAARRAISQRAFHKFNQSKQSNNQLPPLWLIGLPIAAACLDRDEVTPYLKGEKKRVADFFDALKVNDINTMQMLLPYSDLSADIQDPHAGLAIHVAVDSPAISVETLTWLKGKGANFNAQRSTDGYTALHILASHKKTDGRDAMVNYLKIRFLLDSLASSHIQDHNGDIPLHVAMRSKNIQAITLLSNYTSLHTQNKLGETPYEIAKKNHLIEFITNISSR